MFGLMPRSGKKRSCYESKARRSYWQVHLQAWLRSGVTRQEYCRDNRLNRRTMMRWISALEVPIPKRPPAPKKQAKKKLSAVPNPYTIAFKAFWMMHAEAQHGSGLTAVQYANAHRLPVRRMRRESRQFARVTPPQDWRDMLHPSNRPPGAYRSKIRDEIRYGLCITPAGRPSGSATAPSSAPKRRQFSDKQKLAILADAAESGVTVSEIARRHGVTPPMIFRWRTEFGVAAQRMESATLITATVIERVRRGRPKKVAPLVLENLLPMPAGSVSIELADGRRVFAPAGSDPESVRRYIANQESTP
jgi:transposase-like protein